MTNMRYYIHCIYIIDIFKCLEKDNSPKENDSQYESSLILKYVAQSKDKITTSILYFLSQVAIYFLEY